LAKGFHIAKIPKISRPFTYIFVSEIKMVSAAE
jgi:hypothetical protein